MINKIFCKSFQLKICQKACLQSFAKGITSLAPLEYGCIGSLLRELNYTFTAAEKPLDNCSTIMSEEETNIKDDLIELTKLRAVARSEIISANSMIVEVLAKRTNTKQEEEKADNIVKGLEKVKRDLEAELKQLDCIETLLNLCDDESKF